MTAESAPLILVTVGTDAFAFPRLMQWIDRWLTQGGHPRTRVIVQHGSSTPPPGTDSHGFLAYETLQAAIDEATVVVCHGGPSVLEALEHRRIPIVVPRRRRFEEAVDDHQVRFTERMAADGMAMPADTAEDLGRLLDLALEDPSAFRLTGDGVDRSEAVEAFASAVAPLLPSSAAGRPRVLFIAGVGRSGSTLLERVLGEVEGLCSVGELVHLWQRGLGANEPCGCGERFHECPFWRSVGDEAFGGWDRVDARELSDLKEHVDRHRFLPFMLRPALSPSYQERLHRFTDVLRALYRAIAHVSGSVIVDSSKSSSYLYLLRRMQDIDLRLLHLIRDSRGVAYSTTKQVRRPEAGDRATYMPTYHPARAGADWLFYNTLFDVAGFSGTPSMRLRYERFVGDTRRQTGRVLRFAGVEHVDGLLDFLGPDSARLGPIHSVSGNPMRFTTGDVPIRLDEEWRTRLGGRHRATVSLITWPLLRRYGYALRT